MNINPFQIVLEGYQKPEVVRRYAQVGLWKAERQLVKWFFNPANSLLDLGCGAGRTTLALYMLGFRQITGIDLSPSMIAAAKKQAEYLQLPVPFYVKNVCDLTFPQDSIDQILFSYNGIEHIPGIEAKKRLLSNLYHFLKPNGIFIFSFHSGLPFNHLGGKWFLRFFRYWFKKILGVPQLEKEWGERFYIPGVPENQYCHIIPKFLWVRLLKEAGFSILYFNSESGIMNQRPARFFAQFRPGNLFLVAKKELSR